MGCIILNESFLERVVNQTITALMSINWLQIFWMIIFITAGISLAYLIRLLMRRTLIKVMEYTTLKAIEKIVFYALSTIVILLAISSAGIDISGIALAGGIIGIILGFATQTIIANLFAGLFLYWDKPFSIGDFIEVDNTLGYVIEISLLSTRIKTLDGVHVRLPNEKVFTAKIMNYSKHVARRLTFIASISYREDVQRACEVIRRVITEHPLVLVEPKPIVYVKELGDSGVNIEVYVWVPSRLWLEAYTDILWRIKKALTEEGIEIPFPQRDVWFRTPLEIRVNMKEFEGVTDIIRHTGLDQEYATEEA